MSCDCAAGCCCWLNRGGRGAATPQSGAVNVRWKLARIPTNFRWKESMFWRMTPQRPLADAVCRGCRDSVHKIFQRRGDGKIRRKHGCRGKPGRRRRAARMPARMPRRRSGGGGVTCNLHVAAHAACQASQSDSRSLPLPCHHALWQRCSLRRPAKPRPRQTCKRRRRAHYLSRGGWRCRGKRSQLDNTTICLVRRVALSCEIQSYDSWRSAWHASSPSATLQHVNSHDCPARPPGRPPVPAAS